MKLSRRRVLAGAAAGGGLLVAWSLLPRSYAAPLAAGRGETAFDAWLKIARDGVVTVAVPQLETGQGVTTLLPQLVATDLGADWRQVAVQPAPISGAYANLPLAARWAPLWRPLSGAMPGLTDDPDDLLLARWAQANRFTATAEGTSIAAYEQSCREAGASARVMLQMAAAERWDVPHDECETAQGFVLHGDRRLSFGELAEEAAQYDPPSPAPLRPTPTVAPEPPGAVQERVLTHPRLDLPAKVDGSYLFAGDVRLPDMVYAAIRHGPKPQAELTSFDNAAASGQRGLVGVVRGKRFLAAVAETWWAAERALDRMAPRFSVTGIVESARIGEELEQALLHGAQHRVAARGAYAQDDTLTGEPYTFSLRYDVAPAVHATLETSTATARLADGRLELWIAAQAPEQARQAAAAAIGLSPSDVVLYAMPAGGSFERRLQHDHAIEAALIAREIAQEHGRPVQLIWSRGQEQLASHPRTPAAAALGVKLAQDGRIQALRTRIACPPSAREFGRRLFANRTAWSAIDETAGEADPMAVEGAMPPYAIPDVAVDHVPVRLTLPSGRMTANAHGLTCFMVESLIDEVAQRGGQEPLSFRIAMLGGEPRLVECLQRAARRAAWDGGAPGSGQGLACHVMGAVEGDPGQGGRIAVIATASRGEGGLSVRRLVAAVDVGRVINRDIALQQIEGGLLFGLSLALGSSTRYESGLPVTSRLAQLALPTLADAPEIEIELLQSEAEPFDPGEIAVPAVAPAIANAVHSSTGLRLRRLPLLSGGA